jgi:predicted transcriptional regulator
MIHHGVEDKRYDVFVRHMKKARKDAGVTQVRLAVVLGKPQSYVSKIERGFRRMDVSEWLQIMWALDSDPNEALSTIAKDIITKGFR